MTLAFGTGYSEPFYDGSGVSTSSGVAWEVSLGGVAYSIDHTEKHVHSSVPLQRAAQDQKDYPGTQTLNPESFWRRSFESWHVGAGQTHFDRVDDSNPWRFRRSKGIDVWDRYQVSLLNDTAAKHTSTETNLSLAAAGSFLYLTDGATLRRTSDITATTPTWTTITGTPVEDATSMASDGYNVLTSHGTAGIYKTTRGTATTASNITGPVDRVAYGKGRWIATNDNSLYDITTLVVGGGALPSALFDHPNTDFVWNCFAEGPTAFYAGGWSGDKSLIYRLTMKEDGTGLNQPVVAGFLPDGELIQSMQGYLGFVLIGTSRGVRLGVVGGNADLTVGALIPTDDPVMCFEGQDKFVWFGWTDYEGTSGLGRVNLETFSDPDALIPSYASDIMSSTTGDVLSVVTFQNLRVFAVSGDGVYAEVSDLVESGTIDTGLFDYGLTEDKLSLYIDVSHVSSDGGSHSVGISLDREPFVTLATLTDEHRPIATGEARAHEFELRITLTRSDTDDTVGPVLRSWALRAQPATPVTQQIIVPLLVSSTVMRVDGFAEPIDAAGAVEHIVRLCESKEVAVYSEGQRAWSVIVADYEIAIHDVMVAHDSDLGLNATAVCRLKVVT